MTRRIALVAANACALFLLLVCGLAGAAVVSTFDADNNGWAIVEYPFHSSAVAPRSTSPLPFDAGFGSPAGSVRVGDVYSETGITAPAAYLGDKRAFYGGTLTYDIYLRYTDGVIYPAVVLAGAAMSVYYDAPSPPRSSGNGGLCRLVRRAGRSAAAASP
jgi:hypothetical protein